MNFGPSITNWIKLYYCNIESCILNNGWPVICLHFKEVLGKAAPFPLIFFFFA